MKAMVLTAPGELVLDNVPQPSRGSRDVLVRVTHSGICGTDYKIFNGSIPVRYPRIMGHEMAGEVVDAGEAPLKPGDHVIVDPEHCAGRDPGATAAQGGGLDRRFNIACAVCRCALCCMVNELRRHLEYKLHL